MGRRKGCKASTHRKPIAEAKPVMPMPRPLPERPALTKKPALPPGMATRFVAPWEPGFVGGERPSTVLIPEDQLPTGDAYDFSYLSEKAKSIYRLFVAEWIKDYNCVQAIARLGFHYEHPSVIGNKWLREPYVQHLVDKYVRESEQECLVTRNAVVTALVREANYYGLDASQAGRVSALKGLMKVLGMDIIKTETNVNVNGGIMLVPLTGAGTPQSWEQLAAPTQQALKSGVVGGLTLEAETISDDAHDAD
jgi:hypothetical protein